MELAFLKEAKEICFTAKIKVVEKSWVHPVTDELHQSTTVSLIPSISTASMRMYGAYLPCDVYKEPWSDRNPEGFKMWAMISYPTHHFAQVMLCRGNHYVNENHLHIISGVSADYLKEKKGNYFGLGSASVEVTVYPDLTDSEREQLEDYAGIIS